MRSLPIPAQHRAPNGRLSLGQQIYGRYRAWPALIPVLSKVQKGVGARPSAHGSGTMILTARLVQSTRGGLPWSTNEGMVRGGWSLPSAAAMVGGASGRAWPQPPPADSHGRRNAPGQPGQLLSGEV